MRTAIVWFKTDLRLHDNETLVRAINENDQVIPCYCFDERHFQLTNFGFKKTGARRASFLLESLEVLNGELNKLGSSLLLLKGFPEQELPLVAKKYGASRVYAKKEVAHEELAVQSAMEIALWKHGCELETVSTSTLYLATDLPFSIKDIPDVFTSFRKKAEKETLVRKVFDYPAKIQTPVLPVFNLPSLESFGLNEPLPDERSAYPFSGGETQALKRLEDYFFNTKGVSVYKETRNGLIGDNYSSKFSAWLAMGCISPREIYWQLKRYEEVHGGNDSTYWLVYELLWRDYFRFMMKKHRSAYFKKFGISGEPVRKWKSDHKKLARWINGETGEDFVDANMTELKLTGYMSNRGRQNVASYLCNDMGVDWRYGAAYFEEQLIDYDACSNWGNWAYLAGVGNDPRKDRYFNTQKQAAQYDAKGEYRRLWLGD